LKKARLEQADCILQKVTITAFDCLSNSDSKKILAFADEVKVMINSLDREANLVPQEGLDNELAKNLVESWVYGRLLPLRTDVMSALSQLWCETANLDRARSICEDVKRWIKEKFVAPIMKEITMETFRSIFTGFNKLPSDDFELLYNQYIRNLTPKEVRIALYDTYLALGNISYDVEENEEALQCFNAAIEWLCDDTESLCYNRSDFIRLLHARTNKADMLVKLHRFPEAKSIYESVEKYFMQLGCMREALGVRYSSIRSRSKENPNIDIEQPLRELIRMYESLLSNYPASQKNYVFKKEIEPAYFLLLKVLSTTNQPSLGYADDCIKLIKALREPFTLASPEENKESSLEPFQKFIGRIESPLWVISSYMKNLPETIILIIQSIGDSLIFICIKGGNESLEKRILISSSSQELPKVIDELVNHWYSEIEPILLGRVSPLKPPSENFIKCCEKAWHLLPESIRLSIQSSNTILYSPDPYTSTIPLEMFKTENGWLGITHVLARQPSLHTLLEMLSPNATPHLLSDRAYIVRTEDLPGFDKLPYADMEKKMVERAMRKIGLNPIQEQILTTKNITQAMDEGYRIFHYIGHGVADNIGEGLPISAQMAIQPSDLSNLKGHNTPIVYLSSCEVGQTRYIRGGGHTGIAYRFIEKGSPAVIACIQPIPDNFAYEVCKHFYRHSKKFSIGQALRMTRKHLIDEDFHPGCWALYCVYGDPNCTLSPAISSLMKETRLLTEDWSTYLRRYIATREDMDYNECVSRLKIALRKSCATLYNDLHQVLNWVSQSFRSQISLDIRSQYEDLCIRIANHDLIGAASLRLLLAMEILEAYDESNNNKINEMDVGTRYAKGIFDLVCWAVFAAKYGSEFLGVLPIQNTVQSLQLVDRILAGWRDYSPRLSNLHKEVQQTLTSLRNKPIFF
jgi:tetratricopeptide (TPR) repeat protein